MSAEEPATTALAETSTAAPTTDPSASAADLTPAADPTPADPAPTDTTPEVKDNDEPPKSASSPVKKVARPGKPRSSVPASGSKKGGGPAGGENKSFQHGDIVLARLRGYPPWPARVTNPDDAPRKVIAQRPGKSPQIYCVQFFPAGDYAWLHAKDINSLKAHEIQAYVSEPHRKAAGGLMEAYQTAQDPTEWDLAQAELRTKQDAAAAAAEEGMDQLEEDDEDAGRSGKRKRGGEKKGGKKKAKTGRKIAADVESEEEAPATKKVKPAKAKQTKKAPESKPVEKQQPVDDDPLASDPECVRVKEWRHKLQRAFLGKGLPSAAEMETYDELFKTIEDYKGMSIDALTYSKIGKVMKKIATTEDIPRNAELNITGRSSKLMHQWQDFIDGNSKPKESAVNRTANGETGKSEEKPTDEKTNGEKMEVEA